MELAYEIPDGDIGIDAVGMPFVPVADDRDWYIGRWTQKDVNTAMNIFARIESQSPTYSRPPGRLGIAPDDSAWHDWVANNVTALLGIRELDFRECNVITYVV